MKSLLAKFSYRKAIGVLIGEREVVVSKVAATTLGLVQVSTARAHYAPEHLEEVLQDLLPPLMGGKKRIPLPTAIGLAGQRVFFSTRPIKSNKTDSPPEMLLHEAFQSASISVDDMALDVVKAQPEKRPVASIAACRRKYLNGLLTALRGADINPHRAEPAPCALLRVACAEYRAPKKSKYVLRIFMNEDQGLAILAASNLPFVWRYFSFHRGEEVNGIVSAARTLFTLCKPCGITSTIDQVMIHGRPELKSQIDFESLQDELAIPISWHAGPQFDDSTAAYGLAMGCLNPSAESFDLARSLKPRRSLWELFPWGEAAVQCALLVCMALFMAERSASLNKSYASVKAEIQEHVWMDSVSEAELQKEKKELEAKVDAIRRFMGTRIIWTTYAHDIPRRLPANATINGFEGICDLEMLGKKKETGIKTKKFFMLRVGAPIKSNGAMPKDIDAFLEQLREHPLLKKDFPLVELVDLKWYQPYAGAPPVAYFTVMCSPRAKGSGAPPPSK